MVSALTAHHSWQLTFTPGVRGAPARVVCTVQAGFPNKRIAGVTAVVDGLSRAEHVHGLAVVLAMVDHWWGRTQVPCWERILIFLFSFPFITRELSLSVRLSSPNPFVSLPGPEVKKAP